jgi:hypothetical protein
MLALDVRSQWAAPAEFSFCRFSEGYWFFPMWSAVMMRLLCGILLQGLSAPVRRPLKKLFFNVNTVRGEIQNKSHMPI